MLGAFLVFAAFKPSLQSFAFIAAFVSVLSFLLLAWSSDGYNALVGRVVTADLVALVALVIGAAAYAMTRNHWRIRRLCRPARCASVTALIAAPGGSEQAFLRIPVRR